MAVPATWDLYWLRKGSEPVAETITLTAHQRAHSHQESDLAEALPPLWACLQQDSLHCPSALAWALCESMGRASTLGG